MKTAEDLINYIKKKNKNRPENIIKGIDPVAVGLIKQMYSALKDRGSNLGLYERIWVDQIEKIYSDKETFDQFFIGGLETLLKQAYNVLTNDTTSWDIKQDEILSIAEKIIFLKGREDTFRDFYDDLEEVIFSAVQLDFSKRVKVIQVGNSKENLFTYKAVMLNTLLDSLESSVLSSNTVNEIISNEPCDVIIVADVKGKVKFINGFGAKLYDKEDSIMGKRISSVITDWNEVKDELAKTNTVENRKIVFQCKTNSIPCIINVKKCQTQNTVEDIIYFISIQKNEQRPSELITKRQSEEKINKVNILINGLDELSKKLIDSTSQKQLNVLKYIAADLQDTAHKELTGINTKFPKNPKKKKK